MSCVTRLIVLRGTTAERLGFTPLKGELVFDCDLNEMFVGDGVTAGGLPINTVTSIALNTNTLTYTDELGNNTNIDLSIYLDDTNLARLVSGTINPSTGIATFTRDDATTFTIDFSSLIDIETITTLTESPSGVFTYTSEDATVTVIDISDFETSTELDARDTANRDRTNHTGTQTASTISDFAAQVAIDETTTSISLISNTLTYTDEDGVATNIDLSPYIDDTNLARIVSGSINPSTGIVTFTRDDTSTFTVDLSTLLDQDADEVPVTPAGNLSSTDVQAALEELQGDIDVLNATNFGEDNTASNVGTAGVGVFKQKTGVDLEFKNVNAGSNKISVTDDVANNEIDIDVNEANLTITASQVSDFDTEVANNTDVAANTADRHVAATLNAGSPTQESANLVGQELELNQATPTTDGVMSSEDKTKLDNIEANANNYTHPNHTGEVTSVGDGAQTLDKTAISNKTLVTPTLDDHILIGDDSDSDNLKKVTVQEVVDLALSGGNGIGGVRVNFWNDGSTGNKWLHVDNNHTQSSGPQSDDETEPYIFPFNAEIKGLTYNNKKTDTGADIEFYKNGTLLFTLSPRNKKWVTKTDNLSALVFSAGDRLSIFSKEVGGQTKPDDLLIDIYIAFTSHTEQELSGVTS